MPKKIPTFKPHPQEQNRHQRYDAKRKDDPVLAKVARFRGTSAWQAVRAKKKERNPLCEDPYGDHARDQIPVPMSAVHHIIPLSERIDLGLSMANLASLCWTCHNRADDDHAKDPCAYIRLFLTEMMEAELRSGRRVSTDTHEAERSAGEGGGDTTLPDILPIHSDRRGLYYTPSPIGGIIQTSETFSLPTVTPAAKRVQHIPSKKEIRT